MEEVRKMKFIDNLMRKFGYVKYNSINPALPTSGDDMQHRASRISNLNFALDEKSSISIECITDSHKYSKKKIDFPKVFGNVGFFIQQLPLMNASDQIANAYKVVMPEGAVGQLMRYKNGTFGTPLTINGKIVDHAGISPIGQMAQAPFIIFSLMSVVTGQYFMANINKTLNILSDDVKSIINLILDEKESENHSIYEYYSYVRTNFETIVSNPDLRVSSLVNLQRNNIILFANAKFYEKTIRRKLQKLKDVISIKKTTKSRVEEMELRKEEIINLFQYKQICNNLYGIGKILEVRLAEVYEEEYCKNIMRDCQNIIKENTDLIQEAKDLFIQEYNEISERAFINENLARQEKYKIINFFEEKTKMVENCYTEIHKSLNNLIQLNKQKTEFIIEGNDIYLVNAA